LLAYREGPAVLDAFAGVRRPDVVLFDAAGYAHPRRFGLARALGYLLDVPSVGVAKSVLVGTYDAPAQALGSRAALVDRGERVGVALRTREGVRPVFVSRGWGLSLSDCVRAVLRCGGGYRLPEPTRLADVKVEAWKRAASARASRQTR
jgi:deoxyribonuclease V